MAAKEVFDFYGYKGLPGIIRYAVIFLMRFILDKIAFFCPIKKWRTIIHRWRGVNIGHDVYIGHEVVFDRVFTDQIYIGSHTSIGDRVYIATHQNIASDTKLLKLYPRIVFQTIIGRGAWVMPNVTITPGVKIGREAIVATGSVVTKDVPPRCMVAGVPARIIKDFSQHEIFNDDVSTDN